MTSDGSHSGRCVCWSWRRSGMVIERRRLYGGAIMCEDAERDKVCGLSSCHSICTVCKDACSAESEKGNRVMAILEMHPILLLER